MATSRTRPRTRETVVSASGEARRRGEAIKLDAACRLALRGLCDEAFGDRFSDEDASSTPTEACRVLARGGRPRTSPMPAWSRDESGTGTRPGAWSATSRPSRPRPDRHGEGMPPTRDGDAARTRASPAGQSHCSRLVAPPASMQRLGSAGLPRALLRGHRHRRGSRTAGTSGIHGLSQGRRMTTSSGLHPTLRARALGPGARTP